MLAKQEWAISRLTVITFILRNASEIIEADHVPQLGERIKTVSNWAKGSKALGWLGVFIDGGVRTNRVVEACQAGTSSECKKVTFREGGGFILGAGGGAVTGIAGAQLAIAGATALVFGVTLGAPIIAIVAITGAAVGSYTGGPTLAKFGEYAGELVYEVSN